MATSRPAAPIPPLQFPHHPSTYLILIWLTLCLLLTLPDPVAAAFVAILPLPVPALRMAAIFTFIVHSLEALYVAVLLTRARSAASRAHPSLFTAWIAQTALLGFPSLLLLMHTLALSPQ